MTREKAKQLIIGANINIDGDVLVEIKCKAKTLYDIIDKIFDDFEQANKENEKTTVLNV